MTMHYIGVDPSLTSTGVCIMSPYADGGVMLANTPGEHYVAEHYAANTPGEHYELITRAVKSLPGEDGLTARTIRIREIVLAVISFIADETNIGWMAEDRVVVGIERPAFASRTGKQHDRSGLWWYLIEEFQKMGFKIVEISPKTRAKLVTGNGNADKKAVKASVVEKFGVSPRISYDEADAIAICEAAAFVVREKVA